MKMKWILSFVIVLLTSSNLTALQTVSGQTAPPPGWSSGKASTRRQTALLPGSQKSL